MMREQDGLPSLKTIPTCAIPIDITHFEEGSHAGPSTNPALYNWRASLKTCHWNMVLTALLAQEFLMKLNCQEICHEGLPLTADTQAPTLTVLCRTIPIRLFRTYQCWNEYEKNQSTLGLASSPQQRSKATERSALTRQRARAIQVIIFPHNLLD